MANIEQLKDEVSSCYRERDAAYAMQEKYTKAAFNSGGSEESRYKALRNEQSRRMDELQARIHSAEQQLLSMGIYTAIRNGVVSFNRS